MSSNKFNFWRWLGRALWREAELVDRAAWIGGLVVGFIVWAVVGQITPNWAAQHVASAVVVLSGFLLAFALRAYHLEKSITPTVHFGEIDYDEQESTYFIEVHNCGLQLVKDILVKLERVLDRTGRQIKPYVALSTRYHPNVPKDSRFALDPRSTKHVLICQKRAKDGLFQIVHFEHDPKNKWVLGSDTYFLELSVNTVGVPEKLIICAQMGDPPRVFKLKRPYSKAQS